MNGLDEKDIRRGGPPVTEEVRLDVLISRVPGNEDLPLPRYETDGAAGMDLRAAVPEPQVISPGEIRSLPTGIRLSIPRGFEGQVRPRSGLALQSGLSLPNAPGTIDADYRGEVRVILINLGREPVTIQRGDRIAQLVLAPVARARLREVDSLEPTGRGSGGFGHTGV